MKRGGMRYSEEAYRELAANTARWQRGAEVVDTAKPSKYHNEKTNGYASKKESKRAAELQMLERAGTISNLKKQVEFVLIPRYLEPDGKVRERAVKYIADFTYDDEHGNPVVEDCKGVRTSEYVIKRKLMLFVHGIKIRET